MTTLQGNRKWIGLGKQGEKFVSNILRMVQPVLLVESQAILALSWMRYEKLKVKVRKEKKSKNFVSSQKRCLNLAVCVCLYMHHT